MGLPLLYWWHNLGKSGQSMCVMTSRHSCGENQMVNGSIQGGLAVTSRRFPALVPETEKCILQYTKYATAVA